VSVGGGNEDMLFLCSGEAHVENWYYFWKPLENRFKNLGCFGSKEFSTEHLERSGIILIIDNSMGVNSSMLFFITFLDICNFSWGNSSTIDPRVSKKKNLSILVN
jgi:hypothetical protein